MNIFIYEMKTKWKSALIWTFCLLLFFCSYVLGIYPIFQDSMQNIKQMIKGFPPTFAKALGFDLLSMFQFSGFYSFLFPYVVLLGSIMASYFSISIFGEEKRSHCEDFLFSKPKKRAKIFGIKLLSVWTLLFISNICYVFCTMLFFHKYKIWHHAFLASLCLAFIEYFFSSLAIFYTVYSKKIRSVAGISCAFGFVGFIISAVAKLVDETYFYYISPYSFFDPTYVWKHGSLKLEYFLWATFLFCVCLISSFLYYCQKDSKTL